MRKEIPDGIRMINEHDCSGDDKASTRKANVVVVLVMMTMVVMFAAMFSCIRGQERNNPCDPAVATPTVEVGP